MRYYVPDIRLSTELPAQTKFEDKFGGLPWGISAEMWPLCKECGKSQTLLAQYAHAPDRLDLGRAGRTLNIFQCDHNPGMCATWEGGSGANACFILEPEQMTSSLAKLPSDKPTVELEVRIAHWLERDDGVGAAHYPQFFKTWKDYAAIPEGSKAGVTWSTKLGGVPSWVQSPDEGPGTGWKFLGQLDSGYSFLTMPVRLENGVTAGGEKYEGRVAFAPGPNFGDGGIAYLFLRETRDVPEGWFFWQCS